MAVLLVLAFGLGAGPVRSAGGPVRAPAEDPPRAFRLIAYDYKQRTEDTLTYAAYHANLREQILAASTRFRSDVPTLAVLPEDAGLMGWFAGPRGAPGRLAADELGNSTAAIAALAPGYAPAIAWYLARCPGISAARALVLALTDTAWRAFGEGLAAIARDEGLWIMAGLNGPDVRVTRDPEAVLALADPAETERGYAYAGGCEPYNQAVLFHPGAELDPDGAANPARVLAGRQHKVYLVPVEREQTLGLALASESPANARVIRTPFARLGVLTSKDAWMPDVVERLEIDGMDLFVQPEAGAWAGSTGAGSADPEAGFPPDAMTRAIWSMVQWQAETSHGVLSNLTGNLGDLYFDGTATITRDARAGERPIRYLLGRPPLAGVVARGRWVFADPAPGTPMTDLAARRAYLQRNGARLAPGSGDELENGQLASFVFADVSLPALGASGPRLPRPALRSVALAPADGAQWAPSLALGPGGAVHAAWTDLRDGHEQPYVSASLDGGRTWSPAIKAGDAAPTAFDQQDNQYDARIASIPGGGLVLVWSDFRNQSWDVYSARSDDGGRTWSRSVRVDHSPSSMEGFPTENLHLDPAVAGLPGGRFVAVWADARGARPDHGIVAARSADGGSSWEGDAPVDRSGKAFAEAWAPVVAATGESSVAAVWQDHRAGVNRIYLGRSRDGGATWSRPRAIAASRRDQWQPALAAGPGGRLAVAWSEGVGGGPRRIRVALVGPGGRVRSLDADPARPPGARQARPALTFAGRAVWVAWQDDRAGDWDVLVTRIEGGRSGRVHRADDDPGRSHARLPAVAWTRGRLLVAWEDTRTGLERVRAVRLL